MPYFKIYSGGAQNPWTLFLPGEDISYPRGRKSSDKISSFSFITIWETYMLWLSRVAIIQRKQKRNTRVLYKVRVVSIDPLPWRSIERAGVALRPLHTSRTWLMCSLVAIVWECTEQQHLTKPWCAPLVIGPLSRFALCLILELYTVARQKWSFFVVK